VKWFLNINEMNRSDHNEFWEAGRSARRSPEEEAQWQVSMAQHPEALAEFEEETNLNRLLRQLPDAPVSSNFTSQVMHLVSREQKRRSTPVVLRFWADHFAFSWGRKLAFASMLLLLGLVSYQQYQLSARRELAISLLRVSNVLPAADVIDGFSAMDGLRRVSLTRSEEPDLLDALR
jgi:anti-sigma factor RsiW